MTTETEKGTHGLGLRLWIWAMALVLGTGGLTIAGDRLESRPAPPPFFHRVQPGGGWFPDRGGLWHWWNPHCFPRCGGPDDYRRKPCPRVCWPPYPPFYISGAPETHYPARAVPRDRNTTH
jgi:hypothetical protein